MKALCMFCVICCIPLTIFGMRVMQVERSKKNSNIADINSKPVGKIKTKHKNIQNDPATYVAAVVAIPVNEHVPIDVEK
jgi:hypothetical protein